MNPTIVLIPLLPPTLHVWIFRIEWTMTGRKSWIMIMISFAHKTQRALNGHWTCKYWLLTPESQPLALVVSGRGPLASLCRCQKCRRRNKTQRSRSRSGGDKSLIWSRHGPWPVIVDITQHTSAVYSPGIRKLFDTRHPISRGRRAAGTLWQFPRRYAGYRRGDQVRMWGITRYISPSPAVSGSGCKLWWGHEAADA